MNISPRWAHGIALATVMIGCTSAPPTADAALDVDCTVEVGDGGAGASFADVQAFFVRRCAAGSACHGNGGQAMLTLVGPSVYDDLVGHPSSELPTVTRIDPGHPERSYLWLKLDGCYAQLPACSAPARPCGDAMPTLSPISEGFTLSEASGLHAWIVAGAPR